MKPKTEQEIKALAKQSAGEPLPDSDLIAQWKCYVGGYEKGYTQAQQDLLANASESFEEWWESDKDIPEILGRASESVAGTTNMAQRCSILSEFWAQEAWQTSSISYTKKLQEKDAEIESLKAEISIYKANERLMKMRLDDLKEALG